MTTVFKTCLKPKSIATLPSQSLAPVRNHTYAQSATRYQPLGGRFCLSFVYCLIRFDSCLNNKCTNTQVGLTNLFCSHAMLGFGLRALKKKNSGLICLQMVCPLWGPTAPTVGILSPLRDLQLLFIGELNGLQCGGVGR